LLVDDGAALPQIGDSATEVAAVEEGVRVATEQKVGFRRPPGRDGPRLVVLSACETGLYDTSNNPDDFVGLPATFMQLGAAGVIATLWQVDDLATALLMAKVYERRSLRKPLSGRRAGHPRMLLASADKGDRMRISAAPAYVAVWHARMTSCY
jgi:CHAT domain